MWFPVLDFFVHPVQALRVLVEQGLAWGLALQEVAEEVEIYLLKSGFVRLQRKIASQNETNEE